MSISSTIRSHHTRMPSYGNDKHFGRARVKSACMSAAIGCKAPHRVFEVLYCAPLCQAVARERARVFERIRLLVWCTSIVDGVNVDLCAQ